MVTVRDGQAWRARPRRGHAQRKRRHQAGRNHRQLARHRFLHDFQIFLVQQHDQATSTARWRSSGLAGSNCTLLARANGRWHPAAGARSRPSIATFAASFPTSFRSSAERVRERFADFVFERPVPSFKFRKMRLHRHVAFLLASDWLPDLKIVHQCGWNFDARLGCAAQQSPMSYYNPSDCANCLESSGKNRDNFPGCGPLPGGDPFRLSDGDNTRGRT